MTQQSITEKRKRIKKEKSLEKIHYRLVWVGVVVVVAYKIFLEPETIGSDDRYFWYVFLLPTLSGMLLLAYYRRSFIIARFAMNRGFILWTFMSVFYFVQGVIFSYLSFGQVARMSWDYINYRVAISTPTEIMVCDVERFWSKQRPAVEFKLNSHHEEFRVSRDYISFYENVDPEKYQLKIEVRKGIWNYYLVEHWTVERKTE